MKKNKSAIYGKSYEYACIVSLMDFVKKFRTIKVVQNSSFKIAKQRFENDLTKQEQQDMLLSSMVGVKTIIELEPRIIEQDDDTLEILLQADNVAKDFGDIRDILIIRSGLNWEIGISVKHNHAALKHSRLSANLDFGKSWIEQPCSLSYFNEIKPIFDFLKEKKSEKELWRNIDKKDDVVYVPILNAFKKELLRMNEEYQIVGKLMAYLVGSNGKDYYKLIHNNNHTTSILPFNILGTLNQKAKNTNPTIKIPKINLPTRIVEIDYKEDKKNTLVMIMNNGWSISFRIHSASSKVESSLKFDIQLISKPEDVLYINKEW